MKLLLTWLLALALVLPLDASASDDRADANIFWSAFRRAVLDGDVSSVEAKTRFPFEVRGVSDSDPLQYYNRRKFAAILKQITNQKIVVQSNQGFELQTMLDVIKKKEHIEAADLLTPDIFTVELFQFQLVKKHWLFTRAYLEESAP